MSIPFIHSSHDGREEITLILNGKSKSVVKGDVKYDAVRAGLQNGISEEEMQAIFGDQVVADIVSSRPGLQGAVQFDNGDESSLHFVDGELFVKQTKVDDSLQEELTKLVYEGMPCDGMMNFILRLYDSVENPNGKRVSARVRSELLGFIKRNGIVVDTNGDIIAYKAVLNNYFDKHTRKTFKNVPGARIWMDFGDVNDNARVGCSRGLHAGSLDYVASFGGYDDRIVIVRIDPADVVSVPLDCSCQKLRTCAYTVIGDYEGELKQTVYAATDDVDDMYEDDYDRYGYDYDEDENDGWDEMDDLDEDDEDDVFDPADVHVEQVSNDVAKQLIATISRLFPGRSSE